MGWFRPATAMVFGFSLVVSAVALAPRVFGAQATAPPAGGERRGEVFPLSLRWGSAIGVSVRDIDAGEAQQQKLPAEGALVTNVLQASPAERAGLRAGDVIVAFDGERVRSAGQLGRLVNETPPGRVVRIAVLREGQRVEATVAVEQREPFGIDLDRLRDSVEEVLQRVWPPLPRDRGQGPEAVPPFTPRFAPPLWAGRGRLGVSVQDLSPQLAEYFGARQGVLISGVEDGSPAARAGLKAGDVITSIDTHPVARVGDLTRALAESVQGAEIEVEVVRDRRSQKVKVTLGDSGRRRWVRYPPQS